MPETFKPIADKLNSANSILVVLPPLATPDAIAASLALAGYLKKSGKDAVVVCSDGNMNPQVEFLPGYKEVARELSVTKSFVIEISVKRTQIAELSYKKEDDKVAVYLKPKSGEFVPEDVSFRSSKYPHDVIVTVGLSRLEDLGIFYEKLADLFFETPTVNIDFKGSNENFGQLNLVNLNATSNSEIVFDLINEMERELIDGGMATALLAGIIAETNSFQSIRTTPQSFVKASQLVGLGGDQQDIVNRLYKNKSMGFLKLWGRVLARMKNDPERFLVYSAISKSDMEKANASPEDARSIVREMSSQLGFAKIHVFFREVDAHLTEIYCSYPSSLTLASALAQYEPEILQPNLVKLKAQLSLAEAEQEILEIIRKEAQKLS